MNQCIHCFKPSKTSYTFDDKSVALCEVCYNDINNNIETNRLYRDSLENLKKEFGKLINLAEKASTTNKNRLPLSVRKQSIYLRQVLLNFRKDSLNHEKFLNAQNNKRIENQRREVS